MSQQEPFFQMCMECDNEELRAFKRSYEEQIKDLTRRCEIIASILIATEGCVEQVNESVN